MAWSAPMTAVAGQFTAAQWNQYVRDNLNCTAPAVASGAPSGAQWFVSSAANTLAIREVKTAIVNTAESTTSTSFTTLTTAGPSITITTGTKVIVQISARMGNGTVNAATQMTYNISGATTSTGDESVGVTSDGLEGSGGGSDNTRTVAAASLRTVTAGSNTFTMRYKCSSGTGYFMCRRMVVWSF